jgi:hypothetical protein
LRDEGFDFPPDELEAALAALVFIKKFKEVRKAQELRQTKRYDVFLKVNEINGQPTNDTVLLDISAWGAKIESIVSLEINTPVELSFLLPGLEKETRICLAGQVVWAGPMPISKRNQAGLKFYDFLDALHQEGKFPLEKVKFAIQKHHEEITQKGFLHKRSQKLFFNRAQGFRIIPVRRFRDGYSWIVFYNIK